MKICMPISEIIMTSLVVVPTASEVCNIEASMRAVGADHVLGLERTRWPCTGVFVNERKSLTLWINEEDGVGEEAFPEVKK